MQRRSRVTGLLLAASLALGWAILTWNAPSPERPQQIADGNRHNSGKIPAERHIGSDPIDYQRVIQPLFAAHCYACHGPGADDGMLRLDRRDEAVGSAIIPGDGAQSPLVLRLASTHPRRRMPPPKSDRAPLNADQIDLVCRWIDEGASFARHWAFAAIERPDLPAIADCAWVRNPIDAFIAQAHRQKGVHPSPAADRATVLRRLSLDLTGLPPSPAEMAAFLAEDGPDAYEANVDRLLGSPHFGERLALYWLDLVRYADTDGYSMDKHRDVWMYRDQVIDAFNRNQPFDQFTVQQLAGDLLEGASPADRIASGYNRLLMTAQEGCADPKEYRHRYAADRVRNLASVWLGVTMGCCECHDHKFDPFTAGDFYRLAAFFADIQEPGVGPLDFTPFPDQTQQAELHALDAEIAAGGGPELAKRRAALLRGIPATLVTRSGTPAEVRVRPRGNWADDSGPAVLPGLPTVLARTALARAGESGRRLTRLDLARWLVAPDHPLVARVFVNRLWQLTFGRGLVASADDFGIRGDVPTHPELLDWLAAEFIASGWNIKHMVRLIVTSNTYRQSSADDAQQIRADPDNRWLTRQGRFRLDAEFLRDSALAISGLLALRVGGPSVKPYQPAGFWLPRFTDKDYEHDMGEGQYRRGLYTYRCRNYLHPALQVFDCPSRQTCTAHRNASSTPLQALVLLNDPTFAEAARALALRVLSEAAPTTPARIDRAFLLAQSRPACSEEIAILTRLVAKHRIEFQADPAAAAAVLAVGNSPVPGEIDPTELAAWTSAARVILNLHGTMTRQ